MTLPRSSLAIASSRSPPVTSWNCVPSAGRSASLPATCWTPERTWGTRTLIQAHAALLDRRVHRRQLLLLADPRRERGCELLARYCGGIGLRDDRPRTIERVGLGTERELGFVFLVIGQ